MMFELNPRERIVGVYYSTFCGERGRTAAEILAWATAYRVMLKDSPTRPDWCQRKADDEWRKYFVEEV